MLPCTFFFFIFWVGAGIGLWLELRLGDWQLGGLVMFVEGWRVTVVGWRLWAGGWDLGWGWCKIGFGFVVMGEWLLLLFVLCYQEFNFVALNNLYTTACPGAGG